MCIHAGDQRTAADPLHLNQLCCVAPQSLGTEQEQSHAKAGIGKEGSELRA